MANRDPDRYNFDLPDPSADRHYWGPGEEDPLRPDEVLHDPGSDQVLDLDLLEAQAGDAFHGEEYLEDGWLDFDLLDQAPDDWRAQP
jgi:hypothetical protein